MGYKETRRCIQSQNYWSVIVPETELIHYSASEHARCSCHFGVAETRCAEVANWAGRYTLYMMGMNSSVNADEEKSQS